MVKKSVTLLPFCRDGILMNCDLPWAWSKLFDIANFSFLKLKRSSRLDLLSTVKFEAKLCEFVMFCKKFVKQFVGPLTLIKLIVKLKTSTLSDLLHTMQQENFVAISGWYVFVKGIAIKQKGKQQFFSMHYLLVNSFFLDNIFQKRLGQNLLQPGRF